MLKKIKFHGGLLILLVLVNFKVNAQTNISILYPNGVVWLEGEVLNGEKIGDWTYYDSTGIKLHTINFIDSNTCKVYPVYNDSITTEYFYARIENYSIVFDGIYYYENKAFKSIIKGYFVNGKKSNTWLFYSNKKLVEQYYYYSENRCQRIVYTEGRVSYVLNQKLTGKQNSYYTFDDDLDGYYTRFDSLNNILCHGLFEMDCKIGIWRYFENGILESKGEHYNDYIFEKSKIDAESYTYSLVNKDGKLASDLYSKETISSKNPYADYLYLKDGKWEYYNRFGSIKRIEYFDKGELIKVKHILTRRQKKQIRKSI